jgi:hypothetical protein
VQGEGSILILSPAARIGTLLLVMRKKRSYIPKWTWRH